MWMTHICVWSLTHILNHCCSDRQKARMAILQTTTRWEWAALSASFFKSHQNLLDMKMILYTAQTVKVKFPMTAWLIVDAFSLHTGFVFLCLSLGASVTFAYTYLGVTHHHLHHRHHYPLLNPDPLRSWCELMLTRHFFRASKWNLCVTMTTLRIMTHFLKITRPPFAGSRIGHFRSKDHAGESLWTMNMKLVTYRRSLDAFLCVRQKIELCCNWQ